MLLILTNFSKTEWKNLSFIQFASCQQHRYNKLLKSQINSLLSLIVSQELEKKKLEGINMHKDMKKMIKSHEKLRAKADDLAGSEKAVRMLEIVAMLVSTL